MWLQEGRKHDRLSQSLGTLVNGESGPIGRDLEKDPVWLPKIEAPEPKAIDFAAVGHLEVVQSLTPSVVFIIRAGPERHVMHATSALARDGEFTAT